MATFNVSPLTTEDSDNPVTLQLILDEVLIIKSEIRSLKLNIYELLKYQHQDDGNQTAVVCKYNMPIVPASDALLVDRKYENKDFMFPRFHVNEVKSLKELTQPARLKKMFPTDLNNVIIRAQAAASSNVVQSNAEAFNHTEKSGTDSLCHLQDNLHGIENPNILSVIGRDDLNAQVGNLCLKCKDDRESNSVGSKTVENKPFGNDEDFSVKSFMNCKEAVTDYVDSISVVLLQDQNEIEHDAEQTVSNESDSVQTVFSLPASENGEKTKEVVLSCSVCSLPFLGFGDYEMHKYTLCRGGSPVSLRPDVNSASNKPFKCDDCGKYFAAEHSLKAHRRSHHGMKQFKCPFCPKTFLWNCYLQTHIRTHTGEKPYQCSICGRCYSDCSTFCRHSRTHTGKKTFQCSICGKCFAGSNIFHKHSRTHTGEKPYGCNVCGRSFTQRSTLRLHLRIHSNERPFQCDVCGKKFYRKGMLNQHTAIHALAKPFKCFCGKEYYTKQSLKWHAKKHHVEM